MNKSDDRDALRTRARAVNFAGRPCRVADPSQYAGARGLVAGSLDAGLVLRLSTPGGWRAFENKHTSKSVAWVAPPDPDARYLWVYATGVLIEGEPGYEDPGDLG